VADFGSDFAWTGDLDPRMPKVDGLAGLQQSILRRLTTPRGGLFYDPEYGTDMTQFMNAETNPKIVEQAAESEILKDERVFGATVEFVKQATKPSEPVQIALKISVQTQDGPFAFTVTASQLTGAKLLEQA
jgi:phage baseplate assembly protein W